MKKLRREAHLRLCDAQRCEGKTDSLKALAGPDPAALLAASAITAAARRCRCAPCAFRRRPARAFAPWRPRAPYRRRPLAAACPPFLGLCLTHSLSLDAAAPLLREWAVLCLRQLMRGAAAAAAVERLRRDIVAGGGAPA